MEERMSVVFAGRLLGTCDGWDECTGEMDAQFYDFVPEAEVQIPACPVLVVNVTNRGIVEALDGENVIWNGDIIDVCSQLRRREEEKEEE